MPVFFCHFLTPRKCLHEILLDIADRLCLIEQHAVLKMVVEAPVIQVDGPAQRVFSIADALLRVHKARRELKDPNAALNQP